MNLYVFEIFHEDELYPYPDVYVVGVIAENQDEGVDILQETKNIFIPDFENEDWLLLYQTPVHNQEKQIVFQGGYEE